MPELSPPNAWSRDFYRRLIAHWPLKTVAIPAALAAFFLVYFYLLDHPPGSVAIVPIVALDRWISFQPFAIVPYASLWLYVALGAGMARGRRELSVYAAAVLGMSLFGFGVFLVWPNATPSFAIDWSQHGSVAFLKRVDAAGNACPSLHVAFAVFTAIWIERLLRLIGSPRWVRAGNALWALAIVYSTLATKQHLVADALAGAAIGGAAGLLDPRPRCVQLVSRYRWLNRQTLALAISLLAKATVLALKLPASHPILAVVLFIAPDLWILAGLLWPNHSGLIPTATRFVTTAREVWLTIDDGPEAATTSAMLDLLARHQAKATFFVIGAKVPLQRDAVAEIQRRGHSIGLHTQTHPLATFWFAGPRRTASEIDDVARAVSLNGYSTTPWFRPPAGIKTLFLRRRLAERDLVLVGWSARGRESVSRSIDAPLRRLRRGIRPGAILMLHESNRHGPARVALLAALLEHLTATGYRCVIPDRTALR